MGTMSRVTGSAAIDGNVAEDSLGTAEAPASEATGRRREDRIVGSSEATRKLVAQATAAYAVCSLRGDGLVLQPGL